jgi:pimeloyl-ACP methyl ester carboxylesterase
MGHEYQDEMRMNGFCHRGETLKLVDDLRASAQGSFIELKRGTTHYQLDGPEDGQTIVLIHGFSIPFQIWNAIFGPLTEAGFRVLRYDLFGRGYSDRPVLANDQNLFDEQLFNLVNSLGLKTPVDLIGLSMGGSIAVVFCDRHPELVRKLVLINPAGFPFVMPVWANLIKVPLVGELIMSLFLEKFLISTLAQDDFGVDQYPDYVEVALQQMRFVGYRRSLLSTLRNDMLSDLTDIYFRVGKQSRPSLLLWGVQDKIIPLETNHQVRDAIPNIEFHPIERAGHVPHDERPEVVISLLIDFLGRTHRAE